MQDELKQQIHMLVDSIPDETKLQLLMEDVQNYITETGEDDLTNEEIDDIDEANAELHRGYYVSGEDLNKTTTKE